MNAEKIKEIKENALAAIDSPEEPDVSEVVEWLETVVMLCDLIEEERLENKSHEDIEETL
jgi:hypothetical protein